MAYQKGRLGVAVVNMETGEMKWGETNETNEFHSLQLCKLVNRHLFVLTNLISEVSRKTIAHHFAIKIRCRFAEDCSKTM